MVYYKQKPVSFSEGDGGMKDSTEPVRDPFEEYKQAADPTLRERLSAWQTAIGLQAVDGLKTSAYLKEVAGRNIEGEISVSAAENKHNRYGNNADDNKGVCCQLLFQTINVFNNQTFHSCLLYAFFICCLALLT